MLSTFTIKQPTDFLRKSAKAHLCYPSSSCHHSPAHLDRKLHGTGRNDQRKRKGICCWSSLTSAKPLFTCPGWCQAVTPPPGQGKWHLASGKRAQGKGCRVGTPRRMLSLVVPTQRGMIFHPSPAQFGQRRALEAAAASPSLSHQWELLAPAFACSMSNASMPLYGATAQHL